MPTYQYKCKQCDHEFEVKQRMTDDPLSQCPECGKTTLKKIINNQGGFQLKGSGWFKTGGY